MACGIVRLIVVSFARFTVTSWAGNSNRPAADTPVELAFLFLGVSDPRDFESGRSIKQTTSKTDALPDSALKVVVGWGMPSIRTSYWREFAASTRRCESRFAGKFVGRW